MIAIPYFLPGAIQGCYPIDTFFLSTLECLYSNCCLSVLYYFIYVSYYADQRGIPLINVQPLSYVRTSSRFPPNTTMKIIAEQMMVEEWNLSFSFKQFYESCAPSSCVYSRSKHAKNFGQIIILFVSIISGLSSMLRFIIPLAMKIIYKILQSKDQVQQRSNNELNF